MTPPESAPVVPDDGHRAHAESLCAFIDASPSPFHVCAHVADELDQAGFTRLWETEEWPAVPGRYYLVRGGSLVAWSSAPADGPASGLRIVAGHTDSPNLRVKQHPDLARAGWQLVGLEPYGGPLLNSWLDRDLGISGRLSVRGESGPVEHLVRIDRPVLRVPQLAIHLSESRSSLELDPQRHLDAVWGVGGQPRSFADYLGAEIGVPGRDILGWDLMTHVLESARLVGPDRELVAAPRLDNQGTCFSGLQALLQAADDPTPGTVPMLVLFDHEEVGSTSERGAGSDLLVSTVERLVLAAGGGRQDLMRALAGSVLCSGDMAHATHPNYAERHEPAHRIQVNGGPVLKVHQNLRYATDAGGAAVAQHAADQAHVPLQRYMHRADLRCGSTIGPISSARTGIRTVDVGAPQLAMHSARELMGAADPGMYTALLGAFLRPD